MFPMGHIGAKAENDKEKSGSHLFLCQDLPLS